MKNANTLLTPTVKEELCERMVTIYAKADGTPLMAELQDDTNLVGSNWEVRTAALFDELSADELFSPETQHVVNVCLDPGMAYDPNTVDELAWRITVIGTDAENIYQVRRRLNKHGVLSADAVDEVEKRIRAQFQLDYYPTGW